MRAIKGETITDEHVLLNGLRADGVLFDGCIVEAWRDQEPGALRNCTFTNCRIVGDGWPTELRSALRLRNAIGNRCALHVDARAGQTVAITWRKSAAEQ